MLPLFVCTFKSDRELPGLYGERDVVICPEYVCIEVRLPWTSVASIDPLLELMSVSYVRFGRSADRKGVRAVIEPELVVMRRRAGFGEDEEASLGSILVLMEPELLEMERRSSRE